MTTRKSSGETRSLIVLLLCGLFFAFYLALYFHVVFYDVDRMPFTILVPITSALVFFLSLHLLGWSRSLALLGLGTAIAFGMEWVGERTGAVFGAYCYTDLLGPKLGARIPLIIPFAWYMMLLPSYVIANLLGEGRVTSQRPPSRLWLAWMAVLSAGLLTAWDLTMDPIMSFEQPGVEIESASPAAAGTLGVPGWRWIVEPVNPGSCSAAPRLPDSAITHFGVPWLNYRGWLLTGFLLFLVFRWIEHRLPGRPAPAPSHAWRDRITALQAIALYFGMALIDTLEGSPKIQDIHLIAPFAMGIPAAAAAMQLLRRRAV